MARLFALLSLLPLVVGSVVSRSATDTCRDIGNRISGASEVIYPIQILRYQDDQKHWFLSSGDQAACVVEVGSPEDVSVVLRAVGASRTPFAVMSGGHSSNPGFSSTRGVHISLKRFDQVDLSADGKVVTLGFGQGWTDVYTALENTGVNIVGGRVPGPGVGGFTLGGGYSWKTNQYGLTQDTVKAFHVVLPNGTITTASNTQNKDLFFALKGGLNRFGIVTSAEFYTHPQVPKVWGGLRLVASVDVPKLINATRRFSDENTDPKAQIITTLDGNLLGVSGMLLLSYDGPEKPAIFNLFDGLLTVLDNTGQKTFKELIYSFPSYLAVNVRGRFATFSTTKLTARFLEALRAEAAALGQESALHSGTTVSIDIEPFADFGQHATETAYPHADSLFPLDLYFAWANPAEDDWWNARIRQLVATLKQVARDEGIYQDDFPDYSNYALPDTTAVKLYGAQNAARLAAIRDQIDPDRVMELAGGFQI